MFHFQINLRNPFSQRFVSVYSYTKSISLYKSFELQLYKSADLFDLFCRITFRQSHAGLFFGLGVLGYNCEFNFYDIRHWNQESQQFENIGDYK